MVEADKDPLDGDFELELSHWLFIYNAIEKLRTRAQANYNEVILSAILESKIKIMVQVGGLPYHGNGRGCSSKHLNYTPREICVVQA